MQTQLGQNLTMKQVCSHFSLSLWPQNKVKDIQTGINRRTSQRSLSCIMPDLKVVTLIAAKKTPTLKGTPRQDACLSENKIFPLAGFVWLFYQYFYNRNTSVLQAKVLKVQTDSLFNNKKQTKADCHFCHTDQPC